ncbi:hypothetical protein LZK73_11135 [Neorhizobium galegae]|nr:hypothetical protein LZK73_11135 [Neorhizobium galegae]
MARTFRIFRDGAFLAAFFILLVLIAAKLDEAADSTVRGPFHVIDGDTLSVGSERLRLQGMDAPEPTRPAKTIAAGHGPVGKRRGGC